LLQPNDRSPPAPQEYFQNIFLSVIIFRSRGDDTEEENVETTQQKKGKDSHFCHPKLT